MNTVKDNEINNKIENGFELDLGKIIDNSFEIFKKVVWTAGFAYLLFGLLISFLVIFGMTFIDQSQLEQLKESIQDPNFLKENPEIMGYYMVILIIAGALFAPLNAGILNLCHLAKTNQPFSISSIFNYYRSKYFIDIIVGTLIISIISIGTSTALGFLNLDLVGTVIQVSISLFTILFLPLIIFGNQNFSNAIQKSIKLVVKSPFTILGAIIIAGIFSILGLLALCIGMFFTLPFVNVMNYCLYDSIIGFEKRKNEIDEIGSSEEL